MRLLRVVVLLLVLGAALPSEAAAPPLQRVHRSWSFDGTGTGVLVVQGQVRYGAAGGVFAQVAGDSTAAGRPAQTVYFPQVQDLGGSPAATYGALGDRDLCADPVTTCRVTPDGELTFVSVFLVVGDDETRSHVRFHLYLEGTRVRVDDTLVRWRRTPVGGARRVLEADADGAGLQTGGRSVGAHLSATASGGRRGSIAVAAPPCGTAGAGAALLRGPGVTQPRSCPTGPFAAVTRRAGGWTLTGPAAGVTEGRTRLLVLDL